MRDQLGLYEGVVTTRAIRRYLPDDIPPADLNDMLFAATRGPSGHNTQPFRFVVLRRTPGADDARQIVARGFVEAWQAQRREPDDDDTSRSARMARTMNHFVDNIADAPALVFACYDQARRGRDITAGASVYPACQNLLLAARALGYGGVITQWHHPVIDELTTALKLPGGVVIAATIPLGKPAGSHGPVRRLPLKELIYENHYGEPAEWVQDPNGTRYTGG